MEMTSVQFLKKLNECVKEFKKKSIETGDDRDAAHFFNPALKTFLKTHQEEMNILSTMSFDKSFMSWVKTYLLAENKTE